MTDKKGFALFCQWRKPYILEEFQTEYELTEELQRLWHMQTQKQRTYWGELDGGTHKRLNAYLNFSNVVRDDVCLYEKQQSGKSLSLTEIGERLGDFWRKLSDDEQNFWKTLSK